MNYELCKKLKDAGFPQIKEPEFGQGCWYSENEHLDEPVFVPSLSELIKACGDRFEALIKQAGGWVAISNIEGYMMKQKFKAVDTPEEAVANLWLELKKK
jgi:hypothetical protein